MAQFPRNKGFTLLELMLVITVAAVILGLGIPNMTQFVRNNRMTSAANDMLAAIHTARTEAVKRRTNISMCFSDNPTAATPTCTNAGRGWVVFVDTNFNYAVDSGDTVLLQHDTLPATVFSTMKKTTSAGAADTANKGVTFAASGFVKVSNTPVRNIVLCDSRGNTAVYGAQNSAARAVLISATGRPQVTRVVSEITTAGGC